MSNLKTIDDLRDIGVCPIHNISLWCPECKIAMKDEDFWICERELKEEAIKWIKALYQEANGQGNYDVSQCYFQQVKLFMKFFGIKRSDFQE